MLYVAIFIKFLKKCPKARGTIPNIFWRLPKIAEDDQLILQQQI